eukprot:Platyproteum_vivax@DN459_c0_g1_i2.p1
MGERLPQVSESVRNVYQQLLHGESVSEKKAKVSSQLDSAELYAEQMSSTYKHQLDKEREKKIRKQERKLKKIEQSELDGSTPFWMMDASVRAAEKARKKAAKKAAKKERKRKKDSSSSSDSESASDNSEKEKKRKRSADTDSSERRKKKHKKGKRRKTH